MLQTILGALASCLDGLSSVIVAASAGFATVPTALVFLIGAAGMLIFHQVTPFSIQSEIVLFISGLTKDRRERQSIAVYAGLIITLLGVTGLIGTIIAYVGDTILSALMAGVGIMLTKIALEIAKGSKIPGFISIVVAVAVYLLTGNMIYTISISVVISSIVWNILRRKRPESVTPISVKPQFEHFLFVKPTFNVKVLRGTLAVTTMMIGSIIADATIANQLAGTTGNINALSSYMGVAGIASSLFGGAPSGIIISSTTTAPDPFLCGVLFSVFLGIILILRLVPKLMNFISPQGIAGFLFTLCVFIVIPDNAANALSGNPAIAVVTMMVTAFVDPFAGMVAGVVLRFVFGALGMGIV